jgi:hypothetical protein
MYKFNILIFFSFYSFLNTFGQSAKIYGVVTNKVNNSPIWGAKIKLDNSNLFCLSDSTGKFSLNINNSGNLYSLEVVAMGFRKKKIYDIEIINGKTNFIEASLEESYENLNEVVVVGSNFHKTIDSPVSLKNLSASEIERMPGGLRDISRVLQAFPGIALAPAWRNDLIVRGGGSYENKFYLDGIPIASINHFTPQGSSGGAYGIINPNYLKGVDFYSGAFPSNKGNALSSIIELKLKDGNPEKKNLGIIVGSTDLSLTSDGFLTKKITYLTSVRLSNWKIVSNTFGLPILPKYDDLLVKIKYKPSSKNEITFIGIGTSDYVEPNLKASNGLFVNKSNVEMVGTIDTYLRQIANNKQQTYTLGSIFKNYFDKSNLSVSLSRYFIYNSLINHSDQQVRTKKNKILDYTSDEEQNTIKIDYNFQMLKGSNVNIGATFDDIGIKIDNFNITPRLQIIDTITFNSKFRMQQFSAFFQFSHSFKKLDLSFGIRAEASNFNAFVSKLFNQLSPRLSLSYKISDNVNLNFNSGLYNQYPLTTLLSFQNINGNRENADSLKYMKCFHNVIGVDYLTSKNLKIAVELFMKSYSNIPFLKDENLTLPNSVSFVNQQSLGLSRSNSSGFGRCYGLEVLLHQKFWKGYYGIIAYTLMKSEYSNQGKYLPSNWDYRHIISITGSKQFEKNWEIGMKVRFSTGSPFTPLDISNSSIKPVFDSNPLGILDLSKLNSERFPVYHALDIRVEKKYISKNRTISVFADIQNIYNTTPLVPPFLTQTLNGDGNALMSSQEPNKYILKLAKFTPPFNILPTCGLTLTLN